MQLVVLVQVYLVTTTIYYLDGTGLPDGVTTNVNLTTGGSGSGAQATVEVVGGSVALEVTITNGGLGYATTDQNIGLSGY